MPSLASKSTKDPLKVLCIGDSGSGKSGALGSLILAGYELFILDFDNGLDVLRYALKGNTKALEGVHVELLQDKSVSLPTSNIGMGVPVAGAFTKALQLCNNWVDSETKQSFGPCTTWDTNKILVVDTLTSMGKAAWNYTMMLNKRVGDHARIQDWGDAMNLIEQFLGILCGSATCNIIVNAHIDYQNREGTGITKGLPMTLGNKLSPKVAGLFNTMLLFKTKGINENAKRYIYTMPDGTTDAKCPILDAPKELSQVDGLAQIFALWEKGSSQSVSTRPTQQLGAKQ